MRLLDPFLLNSLSLLTSLSLELSLSLDLSLELSLSLSLVRSDSRSWQGWATLDCEFTSEHGVGDSKDSFAYDGKRQYKWSQDQEQYGEVSDEKRREKTDDQHENMRLIL